MNDASNLLPEEIQALSAFQQRHGRGWKASLQHCWERAHYPGMHGDVSAVLQRMRNTRGPDWLDGVSSKAIVSAPGVSAIMPAGGGDGAVQAKPSYYAANAWVTQEPEVVHAEAAFAVIQRLNAKMAEQTNTASLALENDSLVIAQQIASAKASFDLVDAFLEREYEGVVLGVSDCHVVLSLGKAALIIHQAEVDRVPIKGEYVAVKFAEGKGVLQAIRPRGVDR